MIFIHVLNSLLFTCMECYCLFDVVVLDRLGKSFLHLWLVSNRSVLELGYSLFFPLLFLENAEIHVNAVSLKRATGQHGLEIVTL